MRVILMRVILAYLVASAWAAERQCTDGLNANCLSTGCCTDPALACYKRPENEFAQCRARNASCVDTAEWLCPGWELCSDIHDNCEKTACCKDRRNVCYQKHAWYAQCRPDCVGMKDPHTNIPWLCSALREPEMCSGDWEECTQSKCCSNSAFTCFEKTPLCVPLPPLHACTCTTCMHMYISLSRDVRRRRTLMHEPTRTQSAK